MLALGALAAAYFALTLVRRAAGRWRALCLVPLAVVPLAVGTGLVQQTRLQWRPLQEHFFSTRIGAGYVRSFLDGAERILLGKHGDRHQAEGRGQQGGGQPITQGGAHALPCGRPTPADTR